MKNVEVREMKVEELNLDYEPTAEDLTVYLPRSAQYSDGINPNTAKTLFRQGTDKFAPVSVDDIPLIYRELQELAVERAEADSALAAMPPLAEKNKSTRLYLLLFALNMLIISVIACAWYLKRRRHHGTSAS